MFVQQFFVPGLAHSSYLLGGTSNCAVIDPRRDVEIYLDSAASMGMKKITHIFETHLHADFVSGHPDLAEATGAVIVAPQPPVIINVPGPAGTAGPQGATGAPAEKGETGATGMTGAEDTKGERGKQGGDTIVVVPPSAPQR